MENLDQYEYLEGRLVTVFGTLDIQRESAYVTARVSNAACQWCLEGQALLDGLRDYLCLRDGKFQGF